MLKEWNMRRYLWPSNRHRAGFGIVESIVAGSVLADVVGGTMATGLVDAGIGAGLGAAESGFTGGNPLTGALSGGISGGMIGIGPGISEALDMSPMVGTALTGAAGGAAGSAISGGNPLVGALEGGAGGAAAGYVSGGSGTTTGSPDVTGSPTATAGGSTPISGAVASSPAAPSGSMGAGGDVSLQYGGYSDPGTQGASQAWSNLSSPSVTSSPGSALGSADSLSSGGASGGEGSFASGGVSGGASSGGPTSSPSSVTNFLEGSPSSYTGSGANTASVLAGGTKPEAPSAFSTAISDPSISNIGKALGANAGILTSGAGLVNDVIGAVFPDPAGKDLSDEAKQLAALGTQQQSYLSSGTLPAGAQAGINTATKSAIAAIKSKYASMGMSGSSAEQQEIQQAQQNAQAQGTQIAMQLMQQGVSDTQMSAQIYDNIIKNTMTSDKDFASAFTNLAGVVGGGSGGGGTTIKIGGA